MSENVIHVEGLGKRYRVGERERYLALRDVLARAVTAPFRRNGQRRTRDYLWALRDVSFDVRQGEVVGLIGRNGAGKTTLLKILSRITRPTEGFAEIHGRVGSLLEVGTGFHPELTGRENVYLSGAILGMRKLEIVRKFDEIVSFAGVERFIDTPLKHYSTGMQMRLAFAVAAHLEPEILLVDEVLAVGDLAFQKKCIGKMELVAKGGRTIVFVSHNMAATTRLCQRAFWLDEGRILLSGNTTDVVMRYQARYLTASSHWTRPDADPKDGEFLFQSVSSMNEQRDVISVFRCDEPIAIEVDYEVRRPLTACQIGARVCSSDGLAIFTTSDADGSGYSALSMEPGSYKTTFTVPGGFLAPGLYFLFLAAHLPGRHVYDTVEQAIVFEISAAGSSFSADVRQGIVTPFIAWKTSHRRPEDLRRLPS
jgi:lipopolysaccharide transport system ATP-binding protein